MQPPLAAPHGRSTATNTPIVPRRSNLTPRSQDVLVHTPTHQIVTHRAPHVWISKRPGDWPVVAVPMASNPRREEAHVLVLWWKDEAKTLDIREVSGCEGKSRCCSVSADGCVCDSIFPFSSSSSVDRRSALWREIGHWVEIFQPHYASVLNAPFLLRQRTFVVVVAIAISFFFFGSKRRKQKRLLIDVEVNAVSASSNPKMRQRCQVSHTAISRA